MPFIIIVKSILLLTFIKKSLTHFLLDDVRQFLYYLDLSLTYRVRSPKGLGTTTMTKTMKKRRKTSTSHLLLNQSRESALIKRSLKKTRNPTAKKLKHKRRPTSCQQKCDLNAIYRIESSSKRSQNVCMYYVCISFGSQYQILYVKKQKIYVLFEEQR